MNGHLEHNGVQSSYNCCIIILGLKGAHPYQFKKLIPGLNYISYHVRYGRQKPRQATEASFCTVMILMRPLRYGELCRMP